MRFFGRFAPSSVLAFTLLVGLAAACGRSGLGLRDPDENSGGAGANGGSSSSTSSLNGGSPSSSSTFSSSSSTGGGGPCNTPQDCDDLEECTTDTCDNGVCSHEARDDDGDTFIAEGCQGGDDCNDFNPNVHPGAEEHCNDIADNDCNLVADCFDPECFNVPVCGVCVPEPEDCGNNLDDDCDQTVDCNDTSCIGTPACGCAPSETGQCQNGFDDDCDTSFDCDDSDCFADPACQCQLQNEDCGNGLDEDCDLLIDCADPDCDGTFLCECVPPGSPEQCSDAFDNDCDSLVDCADPQCIASPDCQQCTNEVCNDGLDNNCNNQIDCADPACFFDPSCAPQPEICNNGFDDDNDTLVDCSDPDCANNPLCVLEQANCLTAKFIPGSGTYTGDTTGHVSETKGTCGGDAGEAVFFFVLNQPAQVRLDTIGTSFDSAMYVRAGICEGGQEIGCDDDSGGSWAALIEFGFSSTGKNPPAPLLLPGTYFVFVDGYAVDPQGGANEGPFVLNVDIDFDIDEFCSDGFDNDGDIYVDCADPDCATTPPCDTCFLGGPGQAEFGAQACTDGQDQDCDGTTDCGDDDCSASDVYITECCDDDDDNGNGIPDDFNCRCNSDADCPFGQICYTHTAFVCGIPCESFFGEICDDVAAGSFCNATTQQCEF
jgi:hypothetical protein